MAMQLTIKAVNDALIFFDDLDNSLGIQLVGAFTATIQFECSVDGVTWVACPVEPVAGGATVTSATAAGVWVAYPGGAGNPTLKGLRFRARCSAFTSGPCDVFFIPVRA